MSARILLLERENAELRARVLELESALQAESAALIDELGHGQRASDELVTLRTEVERLRDVIASASAECGKAAAASLLGAKAVETVLAELARAEVALGDAKAREGGG